MLTVMVGDKWYPLVLETIMPADAPSTSTSAVFVVNLVNVTVAAAPSASVEISYSRGPMVCQEVDCFSVLFLAVLSHKTI